MEREQLEKERLTAEIKWEQENISNFLDEGSISRPNPYYVKREFVDGKVIETMPNKIEIVQEEE